MKKAGHTPFATSIPPFIDWPRLLGAFTLVLMASPSDAFAITAGDVFCNVMKNSGGIPFFVSAIAYLAGGSIMLKGVFDLVKRSSDPNTPLRNGLLGVGVGAGIFSMPWLVEFLHKTIYKDVSYSGNFNCAPGAASAPGSPIPLDEMLYNFVQNIFHPLTALIGAMAVIFGGIMIFYNMVKLSKLGTDGKAQTLTPILGSLAIGALLMAVGQTLDTSLATLFGLDTNQNTLTTYSTIAYSPGGSFDMTRFNRAMKAVFAFLYIIGLLSFVRGFFIFKNALEGNAQQTKGQAFTHIIGGTLLVNMPGFLRVIEQTTGIAILG